MNQLSRKFWLRWEAYQRWPKEVETMVARGATGTRKKMAPALDENGGYGFYGDG